MSENKNYLYPLDDDDALSTLERGRRTVDTYRQQLAQGHGYFWTGLDYVGPARR